MAEALREVALGPILMALAHGRRCVQRQEARTGGAPNRTERSAFMRIHPPTMHPHPGIRRRSDPEEVGHGGGRIRRRSDPEEVGHGGGRIRRRSDRWGSDRRRSDRRRSRSFAGHRSPQGSPEVGMAEARRVREVLGPILMVAGRTRQAARTGGALTVVLRCVAGVLEGVLAEALADWPAALLGAAGFLVAGGPQRLQRRRR